MWYVWQPFPLLPLQPFPFQGEAVDVKTAPHTRWTTVVAYKEEFLPPTATTDIGFPMGRLPCSNLPGRSERCLGHWIIISTSPCATTLPANYCNLLWLLVAMHGSEQPLVVPQLTTASKLPLMNVIIRCDSEEGSSATDLMSAVDQCPISELCCLL